MARPASDTTYTFKSFTALNPSWRSWWAFRSRFSETEWPRPRPFVPSTPVEKRNRKELILASTQKRKKKYRS
jgi:hypothetical protein